MNLQGFRVESGAVGKPNLPGLGLRRLFFLKLTLMVALSMLSYKMEDRLF